MKKLKDKRVALAGPRKSEEQSAIVKNLGGIPLLRPAQGTVFLNDSNVKSEIIRIIEGHFDWLIVTTGVGIDTLLKTAREMGQEEEFLSALRKIKIAARGYKTINLLKKLNLKPVVRDDDGSTAGLVRELSPYDFKGLRVALQLHGDPAPILVEWLQQQEAEFREILPYKHIPPESEVLELLIKEILDGQIDAVSFTSTPQVRFLFSYAEEMGVKNGVLDAFSKGVVALAVGKVTGQALKETGVQRIVIPEYERMGSALMELAQYYDNNEKEVLE